MSQVAFVSGQLDIWHVKREEKRRYYENKLSYKDVRKKNTTKGSICALFKNPGEQDTIKHTTKSSPSTGAYMMILEINFLIDGGWSLMPLPAIITRFQCNS